MKTFFIFAILSLSLSAFAKPTAKDFNRSLLDNVKAEIKDENSDQFKKTGITRGPASVKPAGPVFHENEKIDKNVRQLGSKNW